MGYSKVFSGDVIRVQYIKHLLQEQGIEPVVKDTSTSALLAGFGDLSSDYQELFVHDDEKEKVLNIIKNNVS